MSNRFEAIQRDVWKIRVEVKAGGALRKDYRIMWLLGGV